MKELTQEEFSDRMLAIQRAKKIFVETGLTNNITHAFEAYQEIFAERERQIFIATNMFSNRPRTVMDKYERPKCPECNEDMQFRIIPENDEGIKTQLVCTKCDTVLSSENDLQWWMENLQVKDGYQRIS
jgi:uncharacterized protein with PIN domain